MRKVKLTKERVKDRIDLFKRGGSKEDYLLGYLQGIIEGKKIKYSEGNETMIKVNEITNIILKEVTIRTNL